MPSARPSYQCPTCQNKMKRSTTVILLLSIILVGPAMSEQPSADSAGVAAWFPGVRSNFHGFDQYNFKLEGGACRVVVPKTVADGKPWVWRAQFWGHQPQFDIALLKQGDHIAFADVGNSFGSPVAIARWDELYAYLKSEHQFADRAVLEGMSRGGLMIYNWAAKNPGKVACIYADNPVCDFKSWPGGKGAGEGHPDNWKQCLKYYNLTEA